VKLVLNRQKRPLGLHSQRGVNIIVLTISMGMIISLWAAVIGLGYMSVDNVRFQNMSNLAALSALDMYAREPSAMPTPGSQPRTDAERLQSAVESAQNVFRNTSLLSGSTAAARVVVGAADDNGSRDVWGTMQLGSWITEAPGDCGSFIDRVCKNVYPCFYQRDPNDHRMSCESPTDLNAVRMNAAVPSQLLTAPFARAANYLQGGNFTMEKATTVTLVTKCTAILLDVSDLSVKDTHKYAEYENTEQAKGAPLATGAITSPSNAAYFAYSAKHLEDIASEGICKGVSQPLGGGKSDSDDHVNLEGGPTLKPPVGSSATEREATQLYWCNLPEARSNFGPLNQPVHSVSDFVEYNTLRGKVYLDLYLANRPEPLTTYLTSLNAVIRDMMKYAYQGDRVKFYAFGQTIVDRVPETGFTSNLEYLAQLTNPNNLGSVTEQGKVWGQPVLPNAFSRGWFPKANESGSNLPMAIRLALNDLMEECPGDSDKTIIAATSGFSNWTYDENGAPEKLRAYCGVVCPRFGPCPIGDCGAAKGSYLGTEQDQLLGDASDEHSLWKNGILGDLQRNHVKFTAIVASDRTQPNLCNKKIPNGGEFDFKTLQDAPKWGYDTTEESDCSSSANNIINNTNAFQPSNSITGRLPSQPTCRYDEGGTDGCAWQYLGEVDTGAPEDNVYFRKGSSAVSKLAYASGGQYCRLLTRTTNSEHTSNENDYVDHDSDPSTPKVLHWKFRTENTTQLAAVEYIDVGNEAARCVRNSMQTSPLAVVQ